MLKVRYFKVDLPVDLPHVAKNIGAMGKSKLNRQLKLLRLTESDMIVSYRVEKLIPIRRYLDDDSFEVQTASTTEIFTIRIFKNSKNFYLSIIDPPRGGKIISEFLDDIFLNDDYFIEPLEIGRELIDSHVKKFDAAKLVSAKIRDFEVYKGAVGRLEVTAQNGLIPSIAPFLEDKFHRIDALTYELSKGFRQGLVYYTKNGTIKVSAPLVEDAFPLFEQCLD